MIKINFEQKSYSYNAIGEGQPYTITTEMILDEDIDIYEAIRAFCRMLNIATYYTTPKNIQDVADKLKEEYGNNRIL